MTSSANRYASEQSWRDLQRKLKGLPEKVRRRSVHRILLREARPLVWAARKAAYENSEAQARVQKKQRGKFGSQFYNLYKTIDAFKSKQNKDYQYVVVGMRGKRKRPAGAYYAGWQLSGGTKKNFKAKDYFSRAEQEHGEAVSRKAARAVNKEIEKILRTTFR